MNAPLVANSHPWNAQKGGGKNSKWNIKEDTNWEGYRIAIETEIDKWWEYTKQEGGIRGRVEPCYNKLVEGMVEAAATTIGRTRAGGKKGKTGLGKRLRKLIRARNKAGRTWRRELVGGGGGGTTLKISGKLSKVNFNKY